MRHGKFARSLDANAVVGRACDGKTTERETQKLMLRQLRKKYECPCSAAFFQLLFFFFSLNGLEEIFPL